MDGRAPTSRARYVRNILRTAKIPVTECVASGTEGPRADDEWAPPSPETRRGSSRAWNKSLFGDTLFYFEMSI